RNAAGSSSRPPRPPAIRSRRRPRSRSVPPLAWLGPPCHPSSSRSWARHALPDVRREPGAVARRLRLRDDQALCPELFERDARVHGPALVEHLVGIAIGEDTPIEG